MDERSLVDALTDVGLDELEAEIYVALLRNGTSQAGSICSLCDASRGKVYDVLSSLVSRGFAEKSAGKPARYRAVGPEQVFEISRRQLDRQRDYVDLVEERTLGQLEQLQAAEQVPIDHTWEILEGRASIYRRLQQAVEDAQDRIVGVSNHDLVGEPIPAVEQTWQALVERAEEGLDVDVLVGASADLDDLVDQERVCQAMDVRRFERDRTIHFVVIDDEEMFVWLVPSEREGVHQHDDVTVHSNAPGLRTVIDGLFEQLWSQAEPVALQPSGPRV